MSLEEVDPVEEVSKSDFLDIIEHTEKLSFSRNLDTDEETKELFHKVVGKAVMNGYKVVRKQDSIVLYREKGELKNYSWGESDQ